MARIMSKLLLDSPPLMILPDLANQIGLNEAIVLQQIHYWIKKHDDKGDTSWVKEHSGRIWVRNTYDQWRKNFSFWSKSTVVRTIKRLEDKNLILTTDKLNKKKYDQTKWYAIDYDGLDRLVKMTSPPTHNDNMDDSNLTKPIPETTVENTKYKEEDMPEITPEIKEALRHISAITGEDVSEPSVEQLFRARTVVSQQRGSFEKNPPIEGLPSDVHDLLVAFIEEFGRTFIESEKAFWIKIVRDIWIPLGITAADVKPLFRHCIKRGTPVSSPKSIKWAYDDIRQNKKETKTEQFARTY